MNRPGPGELPRTGDEGRPAAAVIWAILGAAACGAMIPLEPSLLEEGFLVHAAQRMVAGERLYRDVASFTGPLPFELLALLFRLFGEEIVVGRAAVVLLHGAASASTYAIARWAGAGPLAHAAAACVAAAPVYLFPLFSLFFYTTLGFQLGLVAAWAALRGADSTRFAWAAGVLVACVALCKQTVGAALAAGLLLALALGAPRGQRLRQCLAMTLGGALAAALTVGAYVARGDLRAVVDSLVVVPLSLGSSFSSPYMNLWPPGELAPAIRPIQGVYLPSLYTLAHGSRPPTATSVVLLTQLLYALPFLALAATALRRALGPLPAAAWIHTAALAALMTNVFPRTDWGHLAFVIPAASVQLLIVARARGASRGDRVAWAAAIVLLLALGAGAVIAGRGLWGLSRLPSLGPRVHERPVSVLTRSAPLARVIAHLRERARPGEPIFVARAEPLIYFATGTRNPTPYGGVVPGLRAEQERAILEGLREVRLVVMSEIDQPAFTYYRDELPAVQGYLERHFRVAPEFSTRAGWILVLERAGDRGATVVDLANPGADARRWVRDESGSEIRAPLPPPKLPTRHNRRPLPIALGPRGGGIDVEVEIPEGSVLQADVEARPPTAPPAPGALSGPMRFVVSIRRDGGFETLASALGRSSLEGRMWLPLEADLSPYAGARVTLRLEVIPETPLGPVTVASFGSPRIATRGVDPVPP